jgi:hypothetical protein
MGWFKRVEDLVANQTQEMERRALEATSKTLDWNEMRASAMTGGSAALISSGGWCAPTETMYDLPSIGVRRGGVRFEDSEFNVYRKVDY